MPIKTLKDKVSHYALSPITVALGVALLLLVSVSAPLTQKAYAGGDTRIGQCNKREGADKNVCEAQLEQGALAACADAPPAEKEDCKNRWKVEKISGDESNNANTDAPLYEPNDCETDSPSAENCGIIGYLVLFINVLSALAGIIIVGSIIYAGIQYSMSGSDPQKVSAAKDRIRNAIIALIFFIFGYAIINYLIPGGVL